MKVRIEDKLGGRMKILQLAESAAGDRPSTTAAGALRFDMCDTTFYKFIPFLYFLVLIFLCISISTTFRFGVLPKTTGKSMG